MGDVVRMSDFVYPWKEILTVDNECNTCHVYLNTGTGEIEIVQINDDGESIRTQFDTVETASLVSAIEKGRGEIGK